MPDPAAPNFPPDEPPARRAVVVLGMHRSGTSVVASCLQAMGVDFGPRLMPPNPDNPRGYFEHNDVVNLHDRLLLALDRSWDDTAALPVDWHLDSERLGHYRQQLLSIIGRDFSASPIWGLKDPRLCRLLPWWKTLWTEAGSRPLFILVRRAPQEVAASLARREGMSAPKAHLLWLRHVLEAERWTRQHERVLVDFDGFRADETAALAPIRQRLALPDSTHGGSGTRVDPTLGRVSSEEEADALPPWVRETDDALRLGLVGDEDAMRARLDAVQRQMDNAEVFLAVPASAETMDLNHQLAASRKQARWYEEEWRKTQAKSEKLQTRLNRQKLVESSIGKEAFSNDTNESNMINHNLSIVRKSGKSWTRRLFGFFNLR